MGQMILFKLDLSDMKNDIKQTEETLYFIESILYELKEKYKYDEKSINYVITIINNLRKNRGLK